MKLSESTLNKLQLLEPAQKAHVERIIREHMAACRSVGTEPTLNEQFYLEAIEAALNKNSTETDVRADINKYEPTRRYEVYIAPRES